MTGRVWMHMALAFFGGTVVLGAPYWPLPYAQAELPGAFLGPQLIVLGVITLTLVLQRVVPISRCLAAMACCAPAAVAVRVITEVMRDSTAHNLWPFEIVIALLVGLAAVVPAIGIGLLARRWTGGPG